MTSLAVDAGQTGVRAALYDERGAGPVAEAPGVPRMNGTELGPAEVAAAIGAAVGRLGGRRALDGVGVGLSGLEIATEADLAAIADTLPGRATIATDGVTALLGALGDRPGAVVAAGTGTVAMARDGARWARVDGVGSLLGDAGSGYAIGRAGLDAALRHADGRGGSSEALAELAAGRYGSLEAVPSAISRAEIPTRAVAAFAPAVSEAAAADDAVAVSILAEAGRELADSLAAAARQLFGPAPEVTVSTTGNVFAAGAPLLEPFRAATAELLPGCELVAPAGTGLDGAAVLATAEDLSPVPGILWRAA